MISLKPTLSKTDLSQRNDTELENGIRIMKKSGDSYIGDVDGDGTLDKWQGHFVPGSRFGIGDFQFNELDQNVLPQYFYTQSGMRVGIGDTVGVINDVGNEYSSQDISAWHLTVTNPQTSIQPDYIQIGISFYTQPEEKGLGMQFPIDSIIEKKTSSQNVVSQIVKASLVQGIFHNVKTTFDLQFEKSAIDFQKRELERVPTDEQSGPWYKSRARDVIQRYHRLLADVYEYWSCILERRSRGRGGRRHLNYDDLDYQMVVREIWEDSLKILQDYESHNPADKSLRRQTINDLYFDISFSDLAWESLFYSSLSAEIGFERA